MNVEQGAHAILKRSAAGNVGKRVFVLWQDRIDPVLGLLWRVRFETPSTIALFSTDKGHFVHEGLAVDTDCLAPDTWLMKIDLNAGLDTAAGELLEGEEREAWDAYARGPGIDLYPTAPAPEAIEAELKWPDGWGTSAGAASNDPGESATPAVTIDATALRQLEARRGKGRFRRNRVDEPCTASCRPLLVCVRPRHLDPAPPVGQAVLADVRQ